MDQYLFCDLPIELGEFKVQSITSHVDLNWTTLTEKNNKLFAVERSVDAVTFTKIGEVAGAGNSHSPIKYKLQDLSRRPEQIITVKTN